MGVSVLASGSRRGDGLAETPQGNALRATGRRTLSSPPCSHSCEQLQRRGPLRAMHGQHTRPEDRILPRGPRGPQEQRGLQRGGLRRSLHPLRAPRGTGLRERPEPQHEGGRWGQRLPPQVLARPQRLEAQGQASSPQPGCRPPTRAEDKDVSKPRLPVPTAGFSRVF